MDLALNNLERLICHKTQSTNQSIYIYIYIYIYSDRKTALRKVLVKKSATCSNDRAGKKIFKS